MIMDVKNLYSDDQAVTATATSTNTIDMMNPKYGQFASPGAAQKGGHIFVYINEDFAGLTSLTIALQDSADNSTFADKITHAAVPVADLKAGEMYYLGRIPIGIKRYTRLNYTVTGSNATGGKITAGLAMDVPANW